MSEIILKNRIKSLEQRIFQKGRELSLLKEMSLFLTDSVEKTLDLFAYRMGVLTSAKFVRVYLVDKTSTKLRLVSGYNLSEKYLDMVKNKFEVSIESVPCGKAVNDKAPYVVNDVNKDEVFFMWRDVTAMLGYSSYMALPLFVSERILGAVDIFFKDVKYFSDDEINLISVLSNAGALAIENAMLIEKIANISVVDEDTGAFNYRHFNETLRREVDRAKRYNQSLTLIMMKIIGESPINAEALRSFVSDMKSKMRGSDMLFRYSDNTFCLILTQTPKISSEAVILRLNRLFISVFGEGWDLRIGVSCMPDDGDDAEILLKQASVFLD